MAVEKPNRDDISVEEVEAKLLRLGFLSRSGHGTESKNASHQELLGALTRLKKAYCGDDKPVEEIDDEILSLLNRKRCGMTQRLLDDDFPLELASAAEIGWESKSIKFQIGNVFPLAVGSLSESDVKDAIREAANIWNSECGLDLNESNSSPNIIISALHEEDEPHDVGDYIAHADYPEPNNQFGIPIEMHLNSAESWTIGADIASYDIVRVAIHEFGHCLGLFHHPGTIMNEIVEKDDDNHTIEQSIKDVIFDLYGD